MPARDLLAIEGYLELGLPDEAARLLEQLPAPEQAALEAQGLRAQIYLAQKRWPEAAAVAADLIGAQPEEAGWWINCAYATRRSDSVAAAEQILLRAAALHPKESMILYNLACYACVTGRLDEARDRLRRAAALHPAIHELALYDDDLRALRGELEKA